MQTHEIMEDIQDDDDASALPEFFSLDDSPDLTPAYRLDSESDVSDSDTEMSGIELKKLLFNIFIWS